MFAPFPVKTNKPSACLFATRAWSMLIFNKLGELIGQLRQYFGFGKFGHQQSFIGIE